MLADILKALRRPAKRSSAELRDDLAKINLQALESAVDECEARRRKLLLTGTDEEVAEATRALVSANLEAERAQVAVEELNRQIAAADARESLAQIESEGTEALAIQASTIKAYVELDAIASRMAELLAEIRAGEMTITTANTHFAAADRHDLRVKPPMGLLQEITGFSWDRLPNIAQWRVPGYVPSPEQPALPADRRFCRFVELGNVQLRKSAA